MGKILVIKGVDFSATSLEKVKLVADKISINVLANPTKGGICTGTGVYDEGTQINISATPNDKYEFDSWDDGDTNLQRTIIVDELKTTYVATFINTSLELVKIINGYVSANKNITDIVGNQQSNAFKVLVYDVSEYLTVKVTDGSSGTSSIYELIMCNDIIDDKTLVESGNCYNKIADGLEPSDNWTVELNTDGKRYALVSVNINELKDSENLNISGTRK